VLAAFLQFLQFSQQAGKSLTLVERQPLRLALELEEQQQELPLLQQRFRYLQSCCSSHMEQLS
jgi:hypothetical protein